MAFCVNSVFPLADYDMNDASERVTTVDDIYNSRPLKWRAVIWTQSWLRNDRRKTTLPRPNYCGIVLS